MIIAAVVIVYAVVVALYASSSRTDIAAGGCADPAPAASIRYSLEPTAIDAIGHRIGATIAIDDLGPLEDAQSGLPTQDLTMLVTGTDGQQVYEFAADRVPASQPLSFLSTGEITQWPFDTYTAEFTVVTTEGSLTDGRSVPTRICGAAYVPGWEVAATQVEGDETLVIDGEPVEKIQLTASRSPATIAFGIVILALMVTLPVLGLTVSIRLLRGRRKTEATLMSWIAAMLFATIPLRGFLPGSPPIGSWVDYLVVLWVVAGLVASLVIAALAWLRWGPPGERPSS